MKGLVLYGEVINYKGAFMRVALIRSENNFATGSNYQCGLHISTTYVMSQVHMHSRPLLVGKYPPTLFLLDVHMY